MSSTLPLYTGPELPIILPEEEYDSRRPSTSRAFLSKTPAPGSSIEVRTHPHEYQIWVMLPGFTWDGITLATQKRRVLHIVADKWDTNEGQSTFIVFSSCDLTSALQVISSGESLSASTPICLVSVPSSATTPCACRFPVG